MTYIYLFYEFFMIGLLAVGGGLAALPFLFGVSEAHPEWFSKQMVIDMIAISESTPGPIGINMATYAGYEASGIPGALVATFALILPSLIIVLIIAHFLEKYANNKYVTGIFGGIRPAVAGLIAAAVYTLLKVALLTGEKWQSLEKFAQFFNVRAVIFFIILVIFTQIKPFKKIHPIFFIAFGALIGFIL